MIFKQKLKIKINLKIATSLQNNYYNSILIPYSNSKKGPNGKKIM